MAVRRIIPYHESLDFDATRTFYASVLKLEEVSFGGGYIGFGSGQAQVVFAPPGVEPVLPDMGIKTWALGQPLTPRMPKPCRVGTRWSTAQSTSPGASVVSSFATQMVVVISVLAHE